MLSGPVRWHRGDQLISRSPIPAATGSLSSRCADADVRRSVARRARLACWYASAHRAVRPRTRFTRRSSRSRTGMEQARDPCWFRKYGGSRASTRAITRWLPSGPISRPPYVGWVGTPGSSARGQSSIIPSGTATGRASADHPNRK
jgi:hypothetical protein